MKLSDNGRWALASGIALLLHASPVIWLLWPDRHHRVNDSPAAAMLIELAPVPVAPAVPETDLAPGPEQQALSEPSMAAEPTPVETQPEPEDEPEQEEAPEPDVILESKPDVPEQEEEPEEAEELPQEEDSTAAPLVMPTAPIPVQNEAETRAAPEEAALVNTHAQTRVISWQDRLLSQLNKTKQYPLAARSRKREGISYLWFSMDREGKVLAARLERSSGHSELDTETLALIYRAQPLPPPPEDIPGETIELVVPVEFFLRNVR